MAGPTYTNVTTITDVKRILGDTGTTDANSMLTSKEYMQFVLKHISQKETTWVITEIATNHFRYTSGGLYLFIPSASTGIFTGEDDTTYETTPDATIYVSTGTHAGGDITATAARVDRAELVVDILQFLATHRAKEVSQVLGDGSMSVEDTHTKLMEMAQYYRGVT